MLTYITVKVIKLGIALNSNNFMTLASIGMSIVSIALLLVYYQLQRQIQERRTAEIFLQQQTKRERIVNQIAQHIRQSLNLEKVLATTVAEVRQFLECDRVLIYRISSDGTGSAITETVLTQYPSILGETFPPEVFPSEYHQAYLKGKIGAITNVDQTDIATCLAEFLKQFLVKAKLVVPIIQEIKEINSSSPYLWGLLIAHQCSQPRQWQYEEIELMKQLATQVAIAIQQSEFHEQLQQLNAQLEQRVQQRTEELALSNDLLREEIAERKRLDEVQLALEREKELSALKTRFFSMASHEFRTPLSTVLAAAQLLENSPPDNSEKRLRNLRRIQDSVKNMIQLLDDILTINRAETGKLEFNPKLLALDNFCRQFVEEMQISAGSQHTLTFICQGKSTLAYIDEKLLRSILGNFLSNAIKYSPKGGQIQCFLKFELDCVQLQICDYGIGIPDDDQKQIFEPFYRGKNVRHISGTGLGLVVVKKYVELHGGNIEITSNLGQGTTATIILPLKE